jgi:hypothetical protein
VAHGGTLPSLCSGILSSVAIRFVNELLCGTVLRSVTAGFIYMQKKLTVALFVLRPQKHSSCRTEIHTVITHDWHI